MQYINNDMDELFRKAAEEYPLNTNSANWNVIFKKLFSKDPENIKSYQQAGSILKRTVLVLLLLSAGLGMDYIYQTPKQNRIAFGKHVAENKLPITSFNQVKKESLPSSKAVNILSPVHLSTPIINENLLQQKPTLTKDELLAKENNSNVPDKQVSSSVEKQIDQAEKPGVINNEIEIKDAKSEETFTTSPFNEKENNKVTAIKNKNRNLKQHGLYAGVLISPDISTVKFQPVKNTGFSAGIIIGYQLNKKISFESGVAWNKKYYHSEGKYFNTKNIILPTYAQIKKLDGICKMIEIPVAVRYNFKRSSKTNLSVSAGMSSYIMKNENYNYTIERNGAQYPRKANYNNSSTDLFAVADVGFAYTRNLGKRSALRLEPYVKIPVSGVGIGSLPIMSTGINIAITKKFFK